MNKYIVNSPLDHDNEAYAPGDTVEMSDKHAAPLIALGRIVPIVEPAEKPKKGGKKGLAQDPVEDEEGLAQDPVKDDGKDSDKQD